MSFATLLRCHFPIAATLFATSLAAQATFTTFGTSCQMGLALSANGLPRLGTTFFVNYSGVIGASFIGLSTTISQPLLLLGTSNTQAGAVPLPAQLPMSLTAGAVCNLFVSPDVVSILPFTSAPPFGLPVSIPATPGLIGFTFHAQWLLLSEHSTMGQVNWLRAHLSNAGTAVIGP